MNGKVLWPTTSWNIEIHCVSWYFMYILMYRYYLGIQLLQRQYIYIVYIYSYYYYGAANYGCSYAYNWNIATKLRYIHCTYGNCGNMNPRFGSLVFTNHFRYFLMQVGYFFDVFIYILINVPISGTSLWVVILLVYHICGYNHGESNS